MKCAFLLQENSKELLEPKYHKNDNIFEIIDLKKRFLGYRCISDIAIFTWRMRFLILKGNHLANFFLVFCMNLNLFLPRTRITKDHNHFRLDEGFEHVFEPGVILKLRYILILPHFQIGSHKNNLRGGEGGYLKLIS